MPISQLKLLEAADRAQQTVISMDMPFLLRMMEECRETIQSDVELHVFLEKILARSAAKGGPLTMADYEALVPEETYQDREVT